MKAILFAALLTVALVVSGCGQSGDSTGVASGDAAGTGSVESPKTSSPQPPEPEQGPPDLLLVSEAGRQVGVVGSYCVQNPKAGFGACADGERPSAKQANVARPGETITIALDGARAVKAEECHGRDVSCIGEARVAPLGCKSATAARIFLERGSETRWRAELEPGAYELEVFVYFEADDGRSGDVSAALGLVVDPEAEPEIVPAPAAAAVCQ
jgi:hypothetical protein